MRKNAAKLTAYIAPLGAAVALSACGGGAGDTSKTFDRWQGSAHHLKVEGTLNGEALDIDLQNAEPSHVWCEREYEVPMAGDQPDFARGHLMELDLGENNFDDDRAGVAIRLENGAESAVANQRDQKGTIEIEVIESGEIEGHFSIASGEEPLSGCFYAFSTEQRVEP